MLQLNEFYNPYVCRNQKPTSPSPQNSRLSKEHPLTLHPDQFILKASLSPRFSGDSTAVGRLAGYIKNYDNEKLRLAFEKLGSNTEARQARANLSVKASEIPGGKLEQKAATINIRPDEAQIYLLSYAALRYAEAKTSGQEQAAERNIDLLLAEDAQVHNYSPISMEPLLTALMCTPSFKEHPERLHKIAAKILDKASDASALILNKPDSGSVSPFDYARVYYPDLVGVFKRYDTPDKKMDKILKDAFNTVFGSIFAGVINGEQPASNLVFHHDRPDYKRLPVEMLLDTLEADSVINQPGCEDLKSKLMRKYLDKLVKKEADVNSTHAGIRPLSIAVEHADLDAVQQLTTHRALVSLPSSARKNKNSLEIAEEKLRKATDETSREKYKQIIEHLRPLLEQEKNTPIQKRTGALNDADLLALFNKPETMKKTNNSKKPKKTKGENDANKNKEAGQSSKSKTSASNTASTKTSATSSKLFSQYQQLIQTQIIPLEEKLSKFKENFINENEHFTSSLSRRTNKILEELSKVKSDLETGKDIKLKKVNKSIPAWNKEYRNLILELKNKNEKIEKNLRKYKFNETNTLTRPHFRLSGKDSDKWPRLLQRKMSYSGQPPISQSSSLTEIKQNLRRFNSAIKLLFDKISPLKKNLEGLTQDLIPMDKDKVIDHKKASGLSQKANSMITHLNKLRKDGLKILANPSSTGNFETVANQVTSLEKQYTDLNNEGLSNNRDPDLAVKFLIRNQPGPLHLLKKSKSFREISKKQELANQNKAEREVANFMADYWV